MNKFIGVLFSLVLLLFASAAEAQQPKRLKHCNEVRPGCYGWDEQQKQAQKTPSPKHQTPAYAEALSYAQKPEVKEYLSWQDACGKDKISAAIGREGHPYLCKDYTDSKGFTWVIAYDQVNHQLVKLIRLPDMAKVEFNVFNKVVYDSTGTTPPPVVQDARRERVEPNEITLDPRFHQSIYRHILPYAQSLGWGMPLRGSPDLCDEQGNIVNSGATHACRDYQDRSGKIWRVPFTRFGTHVTRIIRMIDDAYIQFDDNGRVIFDNTNIGPSTQTQQVPENNAGPVLSPETQNLLKQGIERFFGR